MEAPKIIDKIDLDAVDSSTRPKKSSKKTEEKSLPKETVKEEKKKIEIQLAPKAIEQIPEVEITPTIENIKADKLEGPKILGKIDLPVNNDTKPNREAEDKRKRKRIPIERKGPGASGPPPHQQNQQGQ
ncbi:MAG: hypothetical protein WDM71_11970 [Ferruginibacter sp.]